jgi:hypothetical protein
MASKPRKPRPPKPRPSQTDLEAFWRGDPDFIGTVGPPMVLWLRNREKQKAWAKRHALHPREDKE